jgi:hypothetical protein
MDVALRAGVAVYNAGEHHAAHDAWEDPWLELDSGTDDELFLHGLIQFTAAVYHATGGNWSGATGLADSAGDYLAGLPDDYRGVNVGTVRTYLATLAADPEVIERRPPPLLTYGGRALRPADLSPAGAALVASLLAAEYDDRYDPEVVERAVAYAREERSDDAGRSRFTALVGDFAADPDRRALVYRRLADHVERRRHRERDVEGLFAPSDGDDGAGEADTDTAAARDRGGPGPGPGPDSGGGTGADGPDGATDDDAATDVGDGPGPDPGDDGPAP